LLSFVPHHRFCNTLRGELGLFAIMMEKKRCRFWMLSKLWHLGHRQLHDVIGDPAIQDLPTPILSK
jgi:hypothetical protein